MTIATRAITGLRRLLDGLLLALVAVSLGVLLLGRVLPLTGHQTLVVAGPSMGDGGPDRRRGDPRPGPAVQPRRRRRRDASQSGADRAIFTHRIIRLAERRRRPVCSRPRAMPTRPPDPSLTSVDAVMGRVGASIPYAGYLLTLYSAPSGIIFVVSLGMVLLLLGISLEPQAARRRDAHRRADRSPRIRAAVRPSSRRSPRRSRLRRRTGPSAKEVVRASRERRARRASLRAAAQRRRRGRGPEPTHASPRAARRRDRAGPGHRRPVSSTTLARFTDSAVSVRLVRRRHARPADRAGGDRWRHRDPHLDAERGHATRRGTRSIARPRAAAATSSCPRRRPGPRRPRPTAPAPAPGTTSCATTAGSWDSVDSNQASAVVTVDVHDLQGLRLDRGRYDGRRRQQRLRVEPGSRVRQRWLDAPTTPSSGNGSTAVLRHRRHAQREQGPPPLLGLRRSGCRERSRRSTASGSRPTLGTNNQRRDDQPVRPAVLGRRHDLDDDQLAGRSFDRHDTVYIFGATSDTWGRAWTLSELSAANFRVRLIDASSQPNKQLPAGLRVGQRHVRPVARVSCAVVNVQVRSTARALPARSLTPVAPPLIRMT